MKTTSTPTMERIQDKDTVVINPVRIGSGEDTGYPYNLTEEQVMKLVYFFGSRKASAKALGGGSVKTRDFTTDEKNFLKVAFVWFGFVVETPLQQKSAYRGVIARFKTLCDFLRTHPAFLTADIRKALEEYGYKNILKNIVMVVDKAGKIQPRLVTSKEKGKIIPYGQLDSMMWEFQNVALDKLKMIMDSITYKDVQKSNLGMKSKAMRDIYSVIHMARLGSKNPNMTLVNVNINESGSKEKLGAYTAYIQKNRETNS